MADSARKGGGFCSKRWRILLEKVADSARKGGGFCSKRWRILLEKVADSARKGGGFCSKSSVLIGRTIQTYQLWRAIPRILLRLGGTLSQHQHAEVSAESAMARQWPFLYPHTGTKHIYIYIYYNISRLGGNTGQC